MLFTFCTLSLFQTWILNIAGFINPLKWLHSSHSDVDYSSVDVPYGLIQTYLTVPGRAMVHTVFAIHLRLVNTPCDASRILCNNSKTKLVAADQSVQITNRPVYLIS